jgi:hypothetical protein
VAQNEGCFNVGGRTVSVFTKVPGRRLDKALVDLKRMGTEEDTLTREKILRNYISNIVAVHTKPPADLEITRTHLKPAENYKAYIKEVIKKFAGYNIKPGLSKGLATLISDIGYVSQLRKDFLGDLGETPMIKFDLSKSIYSPVAEIISKAEPGIYADMSPFNCFADEKTQETFLIDFESLRNSPYTFDLATAFEMRSLISNKQSISVDKNIKFSGHIIYKKGEKISEKERLLHTYATIFNAAAKDDEKLAPIKDYNNFLKEYYAAATHRALIHFGTFTRLMKTQPKEKEQEYMTSAIECLENAVCATDILNRRFSQANEFDSLHTRLVEIRERLYDTNKK